VIRWMLRTTLVVAVSMTVLALLGGSCDNRAKGAPKAVAEKNTDLSPEVQEMSTSAEALKEGTSDVGPPAPGLLMLSGLKGYTEPCGCTLDILLGGIDRIVGFAMQAQKELPASALVDAGNFFFETRRVEEHDVPQERARVALIAEAAKRMGLRATVPGELDFALGTQFYLDTLAKTDAKPLAVNMRIRRDDGSYHELDGSIVVFLGELEVLLLGAAVPSLYEGLSGVDVTPVQAGLDRVWKASSAKPDADVRVLLLHGGLAEAKRLLRDNPRLDFVLVGADPRETDQVDSVNQGFTLEPYDQGRYLGVLKFYSAADRTSSFFNAREGSQAEVEKIDRQIAHVNRNLDRLATQKGTPMTTTLRRRLKDLEQRRSQIAHADLQIVSGQPTFLWRTVPMDGEIQSDAGIGDKRKVYNESLENLSKLVDRKVVPAVEGQPSFIGSDECASCHVEETAFWKETSHGHALETLVERDKAFDAKCIGCHVVGYDAPGGSVLGRVRYRSEAKTADGASIAIDKNLENVGCESCHGPGAFHRFAPVDGDGRPQHIVSSPDEAVCAQCHVPEHSPRFNFDLYTKKITGPGHQRVP
jgi:hypothetical protein